MTKCHCGKRAIYNISGQKAYFCKKHKEPNMIDVKNNTCEIIGCTKRPSYNLLGKKPRFCNTHKESGMINIVSKVCEFNGCNKISSYNVIGETFGRFCKDHRQENMIDVKKKYCKFNNCNKVPIYNFDGEIMGSFCKDHKEPTMIDVKNKRCEFIGCNTRPTYNFLGEKKGKYCLIHKELDMIDIKNKRCEFIGCNTRPTYNFPGEKKGKYCIIHKDLTMINVLNSICEFNGCNKQPTYNVSNKLNARFCIDHKELNMIDVKHKMCKIDRCSIRTRYGVIGNYATHCAKHKQKGMILYPNKKCNICKQLGTHEIDGLRYCQEHAPYGAQNLGVYPCTSCGLDDILKNGKCSTCDPVIIEQRQHAKENRIRDVLTASSISFIHDKMLEGPICGRERPDFQIDCGTHFVYIEVDENQHQSYACECEQTRMINLVEARGMPVRFIRYNPDSYKPLKGQRQIAHTQREKKLIEYVRYAMNKSPKEDDIFANVVYLFYDEYDTRNQEWHTLI